MLINIMLKELIKRMTDKKTMAIKEERTMEAGMLHGVNEHSDMMGQPTSYEEF